MQATQQPVAWALLSACMLPLGLLGSSDSCAQVQLSAEAQAAYITRCVACWSAAWC